MSAAGRSALASAQSLGLPLAVVAVAAAELLWGARGAIACAAGAALACANLWVLRRLVDRAHREAEAGDGVGAGQRLLVRFALKMMVLCALVYVAVGVVGLAPAPFALGLSVLAAALIAGGLRSGTL